MDKDGASNVVFKTGTEQEAREGEIKRRANVVASMVSIRAWVAELEVVLVEGLVKTAVAC